MSDFDIAAAGMDDVLFEAFGEDATVVRGSDDAVPVRVVIERGVEVFGDYGQCIGRVTHTSFRNVEWTPRKGDQLTLASGTRKVEAISSDDGFVTKAVLGV